MTVFVLGLGYIGLPTALLAARDQRVVGVDIDTEKVDVLGDGELPFEEPGLPELFDEVSENFSARTSLPASSDRDTDTDGGDTYLVATPTPLEEQTRVADLRHVRQATEDVAAVLSPGDTVVLESTVPPGTSDRLVRPLLRESGLGPDEFGYAYCPERAIPGNTLHEMTHNDRVVGVKDAVSSAAVHDLYQFVEGSIRETDPTTAEFVKLAENTHRDVNIAIANEFAGLAEQYGIDGRRAIELANQHPRVDILNPGPGVGGHCLPIDPNFLTQRSTEARLVLAARDINDSMTSHSLGLVRGLVSDVTRPRITVLGVSYKGNVDDTRRTPAQRFCLLAENEGYDIALHDPHVEEFSRPLSGFDAAVAESDCLVILTDHDEYLTLEPETLASRMRRPNVVDTRGLIDRAEWEAAGFGVHVLGDGRRSPIDSPTDE